ncbi:dethiobiotin synthase [Wenzhouxiangella sp. XN79A]|uniref:dethiobiotin synthase n=1 Tax=Wenzhouxiangella sp. XN79A TaxID=2724193 RepID=UPI00144AEE74|nr:dethiobiotin synthase [Wenzhouxiangella sp. XN79A]NKI35266.1 dethiobiotin synthase [Wenzhouxiangella sp. XN79A]
MTLNLFVTGTDTECGKTVTTAALARALVADGRRVACFKPVASGCRATPAGLRNEDAEALIEAMNLDLPYEVVNPVAFEPPIAPHIAAEHAGICIDPARICAEILQIDADVRLVEGAGGWLVPLGPEHDTAALPRMLGAAVVLVVGLRLGCINHALLSARAIRADGLPLAGWIANEVDPDMAVREENVETIRSRIGCPLIARVPHDERPTLEWIDAGPLTGVRAA